VHLATSHHGEQASGALSAMATGRKEVVGDKVMPRLVHLCMTATGITRRAPQWWWRMERSKGLS
jgi:hypothetical protein